MYFKISLENMEIIFQCRSKHLYDLLVYILFTYYFP